MVKPFKDNQIQVFEVVNEVAVLIVGYHCLSLLRVENSA
jgi:hypothetical protein